MNYFECCHHCVPPKRYPGCSGKCPEYKEARTKLEVDKDRYYKRTAVDSYCGHKVFESRDGLAKYAKRRPKKNYRK